jgi:hypothetical protein
MKPLTFCPLVLYNELIIIELKINNIIIYK